MSKGPPAKTSARNLGRKVPLFSLGLRAWQERLTINPREEWNFSGEVVGQWMLAGGQTPENRQAVQVRVVSFDARGYGWRNSAHSDYLERPLPLVWEWYRLLFDPSVDGFPEGILPSERE